MRETEYTVRDGIQVQVTRYLSPDPGVDIKSFEVGYTRCLPYSKHLNAVISSLLTTLSSNYSGLTEQDLISLQNQFGVLKSEIMSSLATEDGN